MKNGTLPGAPSGRPQEDVRAYISPNAMQRWDSGVRAATDGEDRSISVYDVIGHDYWTGEGVTAKRIAAALRYLGEGPVTVNINSPGGDMFEGLAIYNLLREHDGDVTTRVLGLGASAASVIAMAGDDVQVARSGFLMIHNCWGIGIGNRHDFAALAQQMEPFDRAMADIYAARTGSEIAEMAALMDAETWIGGSEAVAQGFADSLLPSDQITQSEEKKAMASIRRVEGALRASGLSKAESMRLLSEIKSGERKPAGSGVGDPAERDEGEPVSLSETAAMAASLTQWRS